MATLLAEYYCQMDDIRSLLFLNMLINRSCGAAQVDMESASGINAKTQAVSGNVVKVAMRMRCVKT